MRQVKHSSVTGHAYHFIQINFKTHNLLMILTVGSASSTSWYEWSL